MTQKAITNIPQLTHKKLSVQVTLYGLSFLVTTASEKSVYVKNLDFSERKSPEEILIELDKLLSSDTMLSQSFDTVNLVYATDISTVVPEGLFDETKASEYLKFNSKILANDFIAIDAIKQQELIVVYVPFININNYFFERYGTFSYYHSTTVLLKSILAESMSVDETKAHINLERNQFDCFITKGSKLLLANTYQCTSPEDVLYYVLFNFEQLQLDPNVISTTLLGDIQEDSDTHRLLYDYIRNVSFYNPMNSLAIAELAPHQKLALKIVSE